MAKKRRNVQEVQKKYCSGLEQCPKCKKGRLRVSKFDHGVQYSCDHCSYNKFKLNEEPKKESRSPLRTFVDTSDVEE